MAPGFSAADIATLYLAVTEGRFPDAERALERALTHKDDLRCTEFTVRAILLANTGSRDEAVAVLEGRGPADLATCNDRSEGGRAPSPMPLHAFDRASRRASLG